MLPVSLRPRLVFCGRVSRQPLYRCECAGFPEVLRPRRSRRGCDGQRPSLVHVRHRRTWARRLGAAEKASCSSIPIRSFSCSCRPSCSAISRLGRYGNLAPVIWLVLASVAFYAFGNWQFVSLLLASIAFNYLIGLLLIAKKLRSRLRLAVLATGIGGDLLMLGIFKYAGFFAANFNALFSTGSDGQHSAAGRHLVLHLLPRSRSWSTPIAARSRTTRCRIMRCSSAIFRI